MEAGAGNPPFSSERLLGSFPLGPGSVGRRLCLARFWLDIRRVVVCLWEELFPLGGELPMVTTCPLPASTLWIEEAQRWHMAWHEAWGQVATSGHAEGLPLPSDMAHAHPHVRALCRSFPPSDPGLCPAVPSG